MSRGVVDDVVDTVELLTSEIVTNAILHGRAGPRLFVGIDQGVVRVGVHDMSPQVPVRRHTRPEDVSGRGVLIVDELASAWGVEAERSGGKRVWFEVACT
jgi:anti-sigma regulatory factor (Ser/Thr protein kinase)